MMKTKNIVFLFLLILSAFVVSCSGSEDSDPNPTPKPNENKASETIEKLWSTSSLNYNTKRQEAFNAIQEYADLCSSTYFNNYQKSLDVAAENMEKYDPILTCYRLSFDRVLQEIKTTQVESGTTAIWMLYNMGYIIKTAKGCFGVDINHRYAEKLEPYLDFLCVTHNHADHYSTKLIEKMFEKNKPVISNYLKNTEYPYTTKSKKTFTISGFTVTTNITDHNTSLKNFVTTFQIDCGSDGGNLVMMHVGDSNYEPEQYNDIVKPVNVFIARYAPNELQENRVIGNKVKPDYVLLSHILELAHADIESSRWSVNMGLERASKINCEKTILPFWGEKLIWKNGKLN